jgi:hypothetical protein
VFENSGSTGGVIVSKIGKNCFAMTDLQVASTAVVIDPNDDEIIENGEIITKDFRGESATETNCDDAYMNNEGWGRLVFTMFMFGLGLLSNAIVQAIVADAARDMCV